MPSARVKRLERIETGGQPHWVGDGFPVRTLFSHPESGAALSPFLLLDHAGPAAFTPTRARRGVGGHPHRGFETVTIVYAGEVEHRDSLGGGGLVGPGDVQWMTAGSGVVHEERHGRGFARRGGTFEMIQLWVNLPARDKMTPPRYQEIPSDEIPTVALPGGRGSVRIIAGEYDGTAGPAATRTPIRVLDLALATDRPFDLPLPDGHTTALLVRRGAVRTEGAEPIGAGRVGVFERAGNGIRIVGAGDAAALLLCGAPIDEPIVGRGPFVMNTAEEIRQAIADYQSGGMGTLP